VSKSLFFSLLLAGTAAAAAPELPPAQRDVLENGVRAGALRDVAVGYVVGGEHATFFFGGAGADSRFEIGALTEVLTGVLLAQAAYEGKARLQSTLRERLPEQTFCDAELGASSLLALATHHARLPATPPNLMPADAGDTYAEYGEADLRAFFANYHINGAREPAYSPLDFGVLAYALGKTYAGTYATVLRDKVLLPLKLEHTDFDDAGVLGGTAYGQPAPRWHFGVLAGSAGLRSTVGDVTQFLEANLRPERSPLRAALLLSRQAQTDTRALGWNMTTATDGEQPWPVLWRASGTAGFGAFMGFRTDQQKAVVLLADSDVDLSALGMSLLDDSRTPPALPAPRAAAPSAVTAGEYDGLYQVNGGNEFVVRDGERGLTVQPRGEPAVRLVAAGEDAFDAVADQFSIAFQREAGKVAGFVLSHAGLNVLATRLTDRAPHLPRTPIATDAKVAADGVGDYALGNDTVARVARRGDALTLQVTGRPAVALPALAKDHFACADESCRLSLRRGDDGAVLGIDIDFAGGQRSAPRAACEKTSKEAQ